MRRSAFESNLHEVGFKGGNGTVKRATETRHRFARGCGHRCTRIYILEPGPDADRALAHLADELRCMRAVERRVDVAEVPDLRSMQNGGTQLARFNGILAAMPCERAAAKND